MSVIGWSSHHTTVRGIRLHSRRATGVTPRETIVFVHGLLVSSRYMRPSASRLWGDVDVWAPDMPGFGLSQSPRDVPDVSGLGTWLGSWLDAVGLTNVILVANSFGCQYAVDYVVRDPGRISALVLTGPTMDPARRSALHQAARWLVNAPMEPPKLAAILLRDLIDCGLRRLVVSYGHALRDAIEAKLPDVEVPTVVMRGERDILVTQSWAEQATQLLRHSSLVVVPGAAHTLTYNSPDAVADVVRDLIEVR